MHWSCRSLVLSYPNCLRTFPENPIMRTGMIHMWLNITDLQWPRTLMFIFTGGGRGVPLTWPVTRGTCRPAVREWVGHCGWGWRDKNTTAVHTLRPQQNWHHFEIHVYHLFLLYLLKSSTTISLLRHVGHCATWAGLCHKSLHTLTCGSLCYMDWPVSQVISHCDMWATVLHGLACVTSHFTLWHVGHCATQTGLCHKSLHIVTCEPLCYMGWPLSQVTSHCDMWAKVLHGLTCVTSHFTLWHVSQGATWADLCHKSLHTVTCEPRCYMGWPVSQVTSHCDMWATVLHGLASVTSHYDMWAIVDRPAS